MSLTTFSFAGGSICEGITPHGIKLTITVTGQGTYHHITGATVSIKKNNGKIFSYDLNILRYYDSLTENNMAMIGLEAGDVAADNNYVSLRYFATDNPSKAINNGINFMRVYDAQTHRYLETNKISCSIDGDV